MKTRFPGGGHKHALSFKPTDIHQLQTLLQNAIQVLSDEKRQRERENGSMQQLLAMQRVAGHWKS